MPTCLDLCSHMSMYLDLCSLHALCYLPCACALHAMFVCLDLSYVCHAMCYCSPFVPFIAFSYVLAYWFEPDLDPMVFVIIHTPRPTSKWFRSSLFSCLCLLASMLYAYVSLFSSRLYHTRRPWQVVVVWLHSTPMRPCLDVTIWDASPWCWLLHLFACSFAFSLVCLLSCFFTCHVYHVYLLYASFICSLHLFLPLLVYWFLVFAFACTHMEQERMELGHGLPDTSEKGEDGLYW